MKKSIMLALIISLPLMAQAQEKEPKQQNKQETQKVTCKSDEGEQQKFKTWFLNIDPRINNS